MTILYLFGLLIMFVPIITWSFHLNGYFIPAGMFISFVAIIYEPVKKRLHDEDVIDDFMTDEQEAEMLESKEFQEHMKNQIEEETWGKGLPKIYMNDKKQIVRHWKDGRIEIINDKKQDDEKL